MTTAGPTSTCRRKVEADDIRFDPEQQRAIDALQDVADNLGRDGDLRSKPGGRGYVRIRAHRLAAAGNAQCRLVARSRRDGGPDPAHMRCVPTALPT